MIGCALDALRLAGRKFPEHAWRSDRRMQRVEVGDHTIRVLDTGGTDPPVLFAADAPVVLEHYLPLFDHLSRRRRAIGLELPGFGFSTPGRNYRFTLAEQVDVVAQTLDALAIERATLAFTCINAVLALAFAARHPERVERLVLAQIPSVEQLVVWARRIDLSLLGRGLLATPILGQGLMWGAPGLVADRWFAAALGQKQDARAFANISRAVYARGGAFCLAALNQALAGVRSSDVGTVSLPTTIVWGDADRTHRKTDKTSSAIWHPDVELIHWADVGHCPDLESPADFASLL